jgi:PEP-CTERM motif
MNWHRLSVGLGIVLAVGLCGSLPGEAKAALINYSFTGTGSGTLDNLGFVDAPFAVSINADTNDVAFQPSLGAFGILNLGGTIDITGVGVATFTLPLFIFGGNGLDAVGFGNLDANGNLIAIFQTGLGLATYDLASNFGPVTGTNANLSQFQNVATDLGTLGFTTMSEVTFVSTVTGVPEPSSFVLSGAGILGFLGYRLSRRRTARV